MELKELKEENNQNNAPKNSKSLEKELSQILDNVEIETLFKVEPPLTLLQNQNGFLGVLLRNKVTGCLQCHLCGKWFERLNSHVFNGHKMKVDDYKEDFGLPPNFPLVSREISEKQSIFARTNPNILKNLAKHRNPKKAYSKKISKRRWKRIYHSAAKDNMLGACPEQLCRRYMVVSDIIGKEPSINDLNKYDSPLYGLIQGRYGTINAFRDKFNFSTVPMNRPKNGFSDEAIIGALIKFAKENHRVPRPIDFRDGTPTEPVIRKRFGSWSRALAVSGLSHGA